MSSAWTGGASTDRCREIRLSPPISKYDMTARDFSRAIAEGLGDNQSTQVVLKLKETQAHKRTPTHTEMSVSRDRLRSKRLCGFRRVSDNLPTGKPRFSMANGLL